MFFNIDLRLKCPHKKIDNYIQAYVVYGTPANAATTYSTSTSYQLIGQDKRNMPTPKHLLPGKQAARFSRSLYYHSPGVPQAHEPATAWTPSGTSASRWRATWPCSSHTLCGACSSALVRHPPSAACRLLSNCLEGVEPTCAQAAGPLFGYC